MDARCDDTAAAEAQREALREAIAFKVYEFDAHGVEMNQRYSSDAVVTDGQMEPAFERDARTPLPADHLARRAPAACLAVSTTTGGKVSTLDLSGKGRFTLFTGIGGEAWIEAARVVGKELGLDIDALRHRPPPGLAGLSPATGPRRARSATAAACWSDRTSHVGWRREAMADDPAAELRRVAQAILEGDRHGTDEKAISPRRTRPKS